MTPEIERLIEAGRIASTDRVCENCTHDWRGGPECPVCDHITPDEDPRERGDDDGREYADPRDERDERL